MLQTINRIVDKRVNNTLNRLHKAASNQKWTMIKGMSKAMFRPLQPVDMKDAYIAISKEQGEYIYNLLLEKKAKHIVEFGTSFGISGLYLGAAARETGGKVITTELVPDKCKVAQQNFEEAGLQDFIELREGDAMETLKDVSDGIDFVLLDGWKDLYLPLMKMLEPKLKKGAVIYTDNASFPGAQPFINYIRSNPNYQSTWMDSDQGGVDVSVFKG